MIPGPVVPAPISLAHGRPTAPPPLHLRHPRGSALVVVMVAAIVANAGAPTVLRAQRERHAPILLQLPVTARSMAMGGLTAATRDVEAVFGNPALVGGANALSVTVGRYASGATTGHVATTMTVGMLGLALGAQLLDAPQVLPNAPLRSDVLTDDGSFAASALGANVAASLSWKGFRWGGAARYVEQRTGLSRSNSAAFDLGLSRDFLNGTLSTGFAVQHLGRDLRAGTARVDLPLRVAAAATIGGYPVGKWIDLGAATHLAVREDGELFGSAGGEMTLVPLEGISLALRGGARRPELRAQRPLTAGVGIQVDRLALDYGWEDMRGKGGAHRVTLRMR